MTNGRRARYLVIGHLGIDSSFGFRHWTFSPVDCALTALTADRCPKNEMHPRNEVQLRLHSGDDVR